MIYRKVNLNSLVKVIAVMNNPSLSDQDKYNFVMAEVKLQKARKKLAERELESFLDPYDCTDPVVKLYREMLINATEEAFRLFPYVERVTGKKFGMLDFLNM
ncbi:hypothetical protein [Marinomonas aquiplantarum]|uniref:Uncharacterized protein n=1 Tax=Marinomonas aquiplantarum TaxID=491951 RepID=A0A366D026_9GAMM|nr:hypothetical protein [Marinomonas aquiplantarum]RBO83423.1 hypothetical protein DFP76_104242 [Marinomonas aquiplantarum]